MSIRLAAGLGLALLTIPTLASEAQAAQRPSEAEAARIWEVLRAQGYRDWRGIKMDDGLWEVDDAMDAQGTRRDLRLTSGDYRLIVDDGEDRLANTEETARLREVLTREGFQRFGEARLDDGLWKVDDAVAADGHRYDLKLERGNYRILHREREG